jgi:hypothetical protein
MVKKTEVTYQWLSSRECTAVQVLSVLGICRVAKVEAFVLSLGTSSWKDDDDALFLSSCHLLSVYHSSRHHPLERKLIFRVWLVGATDSGVALSHEGDDKIHWLGHSRFSAEENTLASGKMGGSRGRSMDGKPSSSIPTLCCSDGHAESQLTCESLCTCCGAKRRRWRQRRFVPS